jgi:hypothetical protein
MKLESLKSSKFEAFKGSELQKSFSVMGGQKVATEPGRLDGGNTQYNCDSYDPATKTDMECGIYDFCQWNGKPLTQ